MAFKSIGTLAGSVLANVENMRAGANPAKIEAARQHTGGMDDEPLAQDMPAHPVSGVEGSAATGLGMEKDGGSLATPASFTGSVDQGGTERHSYGQHMQPALRLVSNRCLDTAKPAVKARSPRAAVSRHLMLVGGRDHASTG